MTLADLAAMAATVEGFVRPTVECSGCDGSGGVFVWYGETRETAYGSRCEQCGNTGRVFDNSPAALAMAVQQHVTKYALCSEVDDERVVVHAHGRAGTCALPDASAESIARALLTALLRSHGVDVPNEQIKEEADNG